MSKQPLVTVIITCFNQAEVIGTTIESVQNQTYDHLQIVVVDDGSLDKSNRVLEELSKNDKRVTHIRQQNAGVLAARNAGFRHCRGEFVQFLDGDDLLHPTKIAIQIGHFENRDDFEVSFTDHDLLDITTGERNRYPSEPIEELPLHQFLFRWFNGVSLPLHASLYRRSIWGEEECPYPIDYSDRCEDWIFLVDVAKRGARFAGIDQVLCSYCVGTHGFTTDPKAWNTSSIIAAEYINRTLPKEYRETFFKDAIGRTLERYVDAQRPKILHGSGNWKVGNAMTKPFFQLKKLLRGKN